ncbi:unnamed protein product, partial [Hymenolepis diminuta]
KVDIAFNQEGIKAHNYLRKLHGCPPLKFNIDLASSAQAYAEVLASKNVFQHSGSYNVGENLARQSGLPANFSAAQVAILWYNEIKNYKFDGQDSLKCGHFSQVIWKDTNEMGMGKALSYDGRTTIVVGHYQPPGNFMGEWGQNVPPVLHGKPRPLTLEELARGMNEDVRSEEKENLVFSKNSMSKNSDSGNIQEKILYYTNSGPKPLTSPGILEDNGYNSFPPPANDTKEQTQSQLWKNYTKSNGHVPKNYDNDSDLGSDIDLREQKKLPEETSFATNSNLIKFLPVNTQKAYPDTCLTYITPSEGSKVYDVSDDITKRMQESVGKSVHENNLNSKHDMSTKLSVSKRPDYLQERYSTTKRVSSVLQTPESGYQCGFSI